MFLMQALGSSAEISTPICLTPGSIYRMFLMLRSMNTFKRSLIRERKQKPSHASANYCVFISSKKVHRIILAFWKETKDGLRLKVVSGELPGSPIVKTACSQCRGMSSILVKELRSCMPSGKAKGKSSFCQQRAAFDVKTSALCSLSNSQS